MTPEVAKLLADNGPWAVVLFIGGIIGIVLWRLHLKQIAEDRDDLVHTQTLLEKAIDNETKSLQNNAAAIAAWNRRNDQDASRARKADKP